MYEFSEIRFDLKGNAPAGLQWADIQIMMATADDTHHGVRIPVLVSADPTLTMADLRTQAFSEVQKLLQATLRVVTDRGATELIAAQDAQRVADAARFAQFDDPDTVGRAPGGDV